MIFPYVSLLKKCIMNNRHANVTAKWNLRNGNEGFAASMRPGTAEYFGIYAVGGAEIVADIFAGGVSGAPDFFRRVDKGIDCGAELGRVGDRESSPAGYKVGGFLEFLMIGTENDRYAVDGGFVEVMDAGAESSADICDVGEAVEGGKLAEGIHDDSPDAGEPCGRWGIAALAFLKNMYPLRQKQDGLAGKAVAEGFKTRLVEFVGSDDESDFRMGVEPGDVDFLVCLPGTPGDEFQPGPGSEARKTGNFDGGTHYVGDAVEAGVAGHDDVLDVDDAQQTA